MARILPSISVPDEHGIRRAGVYARVHSLGVSLGYRCLAGVAAGFLYCNRDENQ